MAFVYLLPTGFALLNGVNTDRFNSFCVFSSTLLGEMAQQTIIRTLFLQMVQFQKLQENRRKKDRFKILLTELRHLVIKGKDSRKARKKCMEAKFTFFLQNTLIVSDHSCY